MKKALVAVVAVAALGAGTTSNAQAHDDAVPFIAGAVLGTVLGVVVADRHVEVLPPVWVAPPPRVVVVERPVVIKRGPPVYVHHPRHYKYRDRRHDDRHRHDWR